MAQQKKPTGPASDEATEKVSTKKPQAAVVPSKALASMRTFLGKKGIKPLALNLGPIPAIPSGSVCIDDLIGGTLAADKSGPKCAGYPRKRITEIYGQESSGKTTAAIQAAAAVQAQGGTVCFVDFEHALDHAYATKVGMSFDEDKLLLYQPEDMEEGWVLIQTAIAAGVDLIIVDSVAAMVPRSEKEKKIGDVAKIGVVAANMSRMLPQVCGWLDSPKFLVHNPKGTALLLLNQVRASISTGGGGAPAEDNTTGGKALKFYCYLRLKFTRIKTERLASKHKDAMTGKEVSLPYGNLTQVKLVKSKVDGKQGYTTEIFIRFNYGIDDYYSLIEAAVSVGVIKKRGAFYEFSGSAYQGRDKLRKHLMSNKAEFQELRTKVLAAVHADALAEEPEPEDEENIFLEEALAGYDAADEAPPVEEVVFDEEAGT
jgi:recombination protein RecA